MPIDDLVPKPSRLQELRDRGLEIAGSVVGLALFLVVFNLVTSWMCGKATVWNYYRSQWAMDEALSLRDAGNSTSALERFRRAIVLNPRNAEAYLQRANVHLDLNDHPAAVADLRDAFRHARSDAFRARACLNLGIVYGDAGNQEAALEALNKAIAYNPDLVQAYGARGAIHCLAGSPELALADLNQAIDLQPDLAHAYAERAAVYLQSEKWSLALRDAEQAISLDSGVAQAHAVRGMVNIERQQYQEAVADLSDAIACDPTQPGYFEWRAAVYKELGADSLIEADLQEMRRLRGEH